MNESNQQEGSKFFNSESNDLDQSSQSRGDYSRRGPPRNRRNYDDNQDQGDQNQSRYRRPRRDENDSYHQNKEPMDQETIEMFQKLMTETPDLEQIDDFEKMNLKTELLRGIYAYGYERPSEIQQKGIMPIVNGSDIIGQAQSGTGKTATFSIGTLQRIDTTVKETQAVILAHTRELADQINRAISTLGHYLGIQFCLCTKGVSVRKNQEVLRRRPHVVIGTPGRVYDMICRNYLQTDKIKIMVLDEADEMLSKGFVEQIKNIFRRMPQNAQVALFSATMPHEFFEITTKFMKNPIKILIKNEELSLNGIKQFYFDVEKNEYKFETLCDLYNVLTIAQSIVYCNSRRMVEQLSYDLREAGFAVSDINGDMSPEEREETMNNFIAGKSRVLVSTDLLSRGIDIQQVSVVINYDLPTSLESYLHRIGRSGRYGRKGVAINFITYHDHNKIREIQKHYGIEIEKMPDDQREISNFL